MPEPEVQTVVETATVDSPQGNGKTDEATTSELEKVDAVSGESSDEPTEEFDLEGFEKTADGQVKFTWGNSVYHGKTPQEAFQKARAAEAEKDRAFREMKARSVVNQPLEQEADEVELPPEPPTEREVQIALAKTVDLDPKLLSFTTDEQWDRYQEEKDLKDRHVMGLIQLCKDVRHQAHRDFTDQNRAWFNVRAIRQAGPRIVKMLVEAGIDSDAFAPKYQEIVLAVKKEAKDGSIEGGEIEAAVSVEIAKMLRGRKVTTTDIEKQREDEKKRVANLRKTVGSGGGTAGGLKRSGAAPTSIGEAGKNLKALIAKGRY